MNLPEFGVQRPVTNLMIFIGVIIISLYGLSQLGIDLMPEIEPPSISVISVYPGAGPEDVEIKVTEALENQLGTTPGLEKILSRSFEGVSVITLNFKWGTNLDEASNDIRDRIERTKRFLPDIPDEMDNPFLFKFNTAMIPIIYIGVTAEDSYPELYQIIDKKVADQLKQIPGVGTVQLNGGLERQINIWVDRERLEGYGFSILDIAKILRQENITQPAGNIKSGLTDYLVRVPLEFASPREINSVILGEKQGKLIYLKDVAEISDGFKERTQIVRINRSSGLLMFIQKQVGANTVQVAEKVKAKLKDLEKELPQDCHFYIINDTSHNIIAALTTLNSTLWAGIVLVVFIVWLFLRQIKPSLIIALSIPFSLLITFIYLFISGKTINVISLSSMVIVSGMVVDAAIVVTDNIFRYIERGKTVKDASILGTGELFLAISASVFTTIIVFVPLVFLKNSVVGIMFGELAMVIIITLLASLFTAATFIPMLCSQWLKESIHNDLTQETNKGKLYNILGNWWKSTEEGYSKTLLWCLQHKRRIILSFLGVFLGSLLFSGFIGTDFLPEEDSGDITINLNMPIGTRVEETDRISNRIEKILKETVPEARYMWTRSGQAGGLGAVFGAQSGSHSSSAGVKLVQKGERKRSDKEISQALRKEIAKIAGVLKINILAGNPLGRIITGQGGKKIEIEIIGNSFEETDDLAQRVKEIIERIPGTVDVTISRESHRPQFKIAVDRARAGVLGLNMKIIADSIKNYIEGSIAGKYRETGETYDINVQLEEGGRKKKEDIENLIVVSPFTPLEKIHPVREGSSLTGFTNKPIRLSNFAEVKEVKGPIAIERKNRERVVKVESNAYGRHMGKIVEDIKKEMAKLTVPQGITISFGGEAEEQRKAFRDLFLLLLLGASLVYMVMAAQFESLMHPFIIMFSIPFMVPGIILGYILTNTPLSMIAFLGIIMLTGIVVNNAIVLISYFNILRQRGLSLSEAVTLGSKDRLRPILMTTLTTLFAMLPMSVSRGEGSEIWQPLGITMLGGLSVSTLITLIFVPILYTVFEERKERKGRKCIILPLRTRI